MRLRIFKQKKNTERKSTNFLKQITNLMNTSNPATRTFHIELFSTKDPRHVPSRIPRGFHCPKYTTKEQNRVPPSHLKIISGTTCDFAFHTECTAALIVNGNLCIFESQIADRLWLAFLWSLPLSNHKNFRSSVLHKKSALYCLMK